MLISNTNVTIKYERYLFLQQTARHNHITFQSTRFTQLHAH